MPKLSKNSVIVIALSVVSLILGGTFFAISQSNSGQNLASDSSNSSSVSNLAQSLTTSQNSSSVFSSVSSQTTTNSQNQIDLFSQSNLMNSQQSSNSSVSNPQPTSSNPKIKPLVADENHDVVVIEGCDLAVKFPKQLKARKDIDYSNPDNSTVIVLEDTNKLNGKLKPSSIYNLECSNKKYEIIQAEAINDKNFVDESGLDLSKVLELQRYNAPALGGISLIKDEGVGGEVTTFTRNNVDQFLYYFLRKNKFYQLDTPIIQIQFNSLAPSAPSVKL